MVPRTLMILGVASRLFRAVTSSERLLTTKTWAASAAAPPVVPVVAAPQPSLAARVSRDWSTSADAAIASGQAAAIDNAAATRGPKTRMVGNLQPGTRQR